MPIYKIMLQFEVQAVVAYVEAETFAEAEQKCLARYNGERFPQIKSAVCFSGPVRQSGRYADF